MSIQNAGAFSSTDNEDSSETTEVPVEEYEWLKETVKRQNEQIETLFSIVNENTDRLDNVEDEVQEYREYNEKDKAEIRSDVHEADEQTETNFNLFDTLNQKVKEFSGELKRVNDGRNSLEQIVRLPDEIAQETLSKNQLRARAVVSNIASVRSEQAFHGRKLIKSSSIREKLRETYSKAHHQTVTRVMEFIEEMGGKGVQLKQEDGRNKLVFERDLVDQLQSVEQLDAEDIDQVNTSGVMAQMRGG